MDALNQPCRSIFALVLCRITVQSLIIGPLLSRLIHGGNAPDLV